MDPIPETGNEPRGQSSVAPEEVQVRFRGRRCDGTVSQTVPAFYTRAVSILDGGVTRYTGFEGTKWFHDTALALYNVAGGNPTNKTALDNLANQIATDFYKWTLTSFDESFARIIAPALDGLTDQVQFNYRPGMPAMTRRMSAPHNAQAEELMHHDPANSGCADSGSGASAVITAKTPCVEFYGPPGRCVSGKPRLTRYKLCLIDGYLIQTYVSEDIIE